MNKPDKKHLGTYIKQTIGGETYSSYIPPKLLPSPRINLEKLYPLLEKATQAVTTVNTIASSIPNTSLFIYMFVRKEALLSSQIEGTQSSFHDLMLFENDQKTSIEPEDVEEVSNYVFAINYGLEKIRNGFPLSLRLIREIHAILLQGTRGSRKSPGEFRKSQNWIGGTRPGNALFVPPSPDHLMSCLDDFEKFLHDKTNKLPIFIKAGLAHVQFETIHPFLDGNGRLGRLLIILLLCENGILTEPILYISYYLKQHRNFYYDLLQEVRLHGQWDTWLTFFLEGIIITAQQVQHATEKINTLFEHDSLKITTLNRAHISALAIFDYLKTLPQVTVPTIAKNLKISAPTARSGLNNLVTLGILEEVSGKQRDKVYVYKKYLKILEEGAEPL